MKTAAAILLLGWLILPKSTKGLSGYMTLDQLQEGAKFRTPGRRRILTKIKNFSWQAHPIRDKESGRIIGEIKHCVVKNSSGKKYDMPADKEVIPI